MPIKLPDPELLPRHVLVDIVRRVQALAWMEPHEDASATVLAVAEVLAAAGLGPEKKDV